jgi:hypothetical protein
MKSLQRKMERGIPKWRKYLWLILLRFFIAECDYR